MCNVYEYICKSRYLNEVLKLDARMGKVFENFRVLESKRQPRNLKPILCKSYLRNNNCHTVNINDVEPVHI